MTILDTYGELELPEEKSVIEVVENPIQVIFSYYELFSKTIAKELFETIDQRWWYCNYQEWVSPSYKKTLALFDEKPKLELNEEKADELLKLIRASEEKKTEKNIGQVGLFLSAVHSSTDLEVLVLDDFKHLDFIGYYLPENKTVVIGSKIILSNNDITGMNCIGGTQAKGNVINYGSIYSVGRSSESGVHINLESVQQICWHSQGGVHINEKNTKDMGLCSAKGIMINNGLVQWSFPHDGIEKICIMNKGSSNIIYPGNYGTKHIINLKPKHFHQLKSKLNKKLEEINFLKKLRNKDYETIVKHIKGFNFKQFEQDITTIAREIKTYHDQVK